MITDMVTILQREVLALVANGCKHIKIDEPALLSYPVRALEHGVDDIREIFAACPDDVKKEVILSSERTPSEEITEALARADIFTSQ